MDEQVVDRGAVPLGFMNESPLAVARTLCPEIVRGLKEYPLPANPSAFDDGFRPRDRTLDALLAEIGVERAAEAVQGVRRLVEERMRGIGWISGRHTAAAKAILHHCAAVHSLRPTELHALFHAVTGQGIEKFAEGAARGSAARA
jgi:hypothetical protein